MKNLLPGAARRFVLIALASVFITACGDGAYYAGLSSDGEFKVPHVNDLPDFPDGAVPAITEAEAKKILSEFRASEILSELQYNLRQLINDHAENPDDFAFENREGYGLRASAAFEETGDVSEAVEELFAMEDLFDDESEEFTNYLETANFTESDFSESSGIKKFNLVTLDEIAGWNGVVLAGCVYAEDKTRLNSMTVTRAGDYMGAGLKEEDNLKFAAALCFSFAGDSGGVKVIFSMTYEYKNVVNYNGFPDRFPGKKGQTSEKYSGSIKVYGESNRPLINLDILTTADADQACYLLGITWPLYDAGRASAH